MTVSPEERDAMARIMMMMEGKTPSNLSKSNSNTVAEVELLGPGQVTTADVNAMADVLRKLNNVSDQLVGEMITESSRDPEMRTAISTVRNESGVKVGLYQIMIKEDEKRLAGKQYYSIYNTRTGDVIADDLSLYETAFNVVKLLNDGKYTNSHDVRKLFEYDDSYTSHRQDALRYKRGVMISNKKGDSHRAALYESRMQASMDRAMQAKKEIKTFKSA
jgi:hypothetical protein